MATVPEIAKLRVQERKLARKAKLLGWDMAISLKYRYHQKAYPRRTICAKTKVQA